MFKFFLRRKAEDSIQPTGDDPPIPRKGSTAVLRKKDHQTVPASNRNSHPLPPLPSSELGYHSVSASNSRVLRKSYHAASALNPPPSSDCNSPLPPLPENSYYAVPPASKVPFSDHSVPVSDGEVQRDLRKNYYAVPASNRNSHPLSDLDYLSVPASNGAPYPLPSSERDYYAVPTSNVPSAEPKSSIPASTSTAHHALRKNSARPLPSSERNNYAVPASSVPSSKERKSSVPASSSAAHVLWKNYPSVPVSNPKTHPLPSSGRNYRSVAFSNYFPQPLPSSERKDHAVPVANRKPRRVPSSERNYFPASSGENRQIPRENDPLASTSNHTPYPLPSSERDSRSVPASNRKVRRVPSSERTYPSVPAQQVPKENYPPASTSNHTSHLLPSSERKYRSVPASNRKARRVPSSERTYHAVPTSNSENQQIPRDNYPPVAASNDNSRRLPSSERHYRAASNRKPRRVPSSERDYHAVPASNSEDQQVPRENYPPVSTSNHTPRSVPASNRKARRVPSSERKYYAVPASNSDDQQVPSQNYPPVSASNDYSYPLPSSERDDRSVPAANRQARQVLRNNYAVPFSNSDLQSPGFGTQSCNYCHRRPKFRHYDQCGRTCGNAAKIACLLCRSRPRYKLLPLCVSCCELLPTMRAPLLLEAPMGHAMWDLVLKKFQNSWNYATCPTIKKIYKLIGSKALLQRYEQYRQRLGKHTEVFCYHGTSRKCTLGSNGNTVLCNDNGCALCSILKSSFKTSCADPNGAFGPGIYTSSAANKGYSYCANGQGALLVTKMVLGKVYYVNKFAAVSRCPPGYNSVVFNRQGGTLNETVVYSDDAIRPVFLILFQ